MKLIVENTLKNVEPRALQLFASLINSIIASGNEDVLRIFMDLEVIDNPDFGNYFKYGFGKGHLWVCEAGKTERLIFVEF